MASQVITTQDFINAASAALAIDDSEALQLSNATEQQKAHDYNGMWDSVDSSKSVAGSSQQRNAGSNSTVGTAGLHEPAMQMYASSGTKVKLGRGKFSGDKAVSNSTPTASAPAVKTDKSSGNATTEVLRAAITRSNAFAKASHAESARSGASAWTGSDPSGDPTYNTWKLHLEKSLLHALSRAASKGNAAPTRSPGFVPGTTQNSSDERMLRPESTARAKAVLDPRGGHAMPPVQGTGAQARTPSNRTSVSSLVGSMATAIKESASELKREQAEAKREQAEARRELEEAKGEQATAKHEQEEANNEKLEAKHTLTKAKRAADAAFAAGAISSSRGVAHSQLRPRRDEQQQQLHLVHAPDPSAAPSSGRHNAGIAAQTRPRDPATTAFGMPVRDARSAAGGVSELSADRTEHQAKSSARAGVSWKMFGTKEWRPSSAADKTRATAHRPAKSNEPSSEDLLNAELAVKFGTPAHALAAALRGA